MSTQGKTQKKQTQAKKTRTISPDKLLTQREHFQKLEEALVTGKLPVNQPLFKYGDNPDYPIHTVLWHNKHKALSLLRRHGVDVNQPTNDYRAIPPLFIPLMRGISQLHITLELLDAGAHISSTDGQGDNILHLIGKTHNSKAFWKIKEKLKNPSWISELLNQQNDKGNTPLHSVSKKLTKLPYVELSPPDSLETTHMGRSRKFLTSIRSIFLNHGANTDIKNNANQTAHDIFELNRIFKTKETEQAPTTLRFKA